MSEEADLTAAVLMTRLRVPKTDTRHPSRRHERRDAASRGWFNWYASRGRLSLSPTRSELRRVSWRRAH